MQTILTITVPFFALILAGYVAARRAWVPTEAVPAFNGFLLYFAVPAMLFRFASTTPFREIANGPLFLAWTAAGLLVLLATVWIGRRIGLGLRDAAFLGLAGGVGNLGFLGVPLLVALLGERAAAPTIVAIVADLAVLASVGLAIAALDPAGGIERRQGLRDIALRVALNPMLVAMAAGAVFSYFAWKPWTPVSEMVRLLADAAGPCALFAIGVSLVRPDAPLRSRVVALPVAAKLVAHPLVAALALRAAGVDPFASGVALLAAALPSAGWVFIFAQRHDADAGRVAAAILLTTALAFVTFSALVWALGVAPPPR
jgi:malonate transporter and related proteins